MVNTCTVYIHIYILLVKEMKITMIHMKEKAQPAPAQKELLYTDSYSDFYVQY